MRARPAFAALAGRAEAAVTDLVLYSAYGEVRLWPRRAVWGSAEWFACFGAFEGRLSGFAVEVFLLIEWPGPRFWNEWASHLNSVIADYT